MSDVLNYDWFANSIASRLQDIDSAIKGVELYPALTTAELAHTMLEFVHTGITEVRRERRPCEAIFGQQHIKFTADEVDRAYELVGGTLIQLENKLRTLNMMEEKIGQAIEFRQVGGKQPYLPEGFIYLRKKGQDAVCTIGVKLEASPCGHDHLKHGHLRCSGSYDEAIALSLDGFATRVVALNTERYPFAATALPLVIRKYEKELGFARDNACLQ